jgi:hypothetical protein
MNSLNPFRACTFSQMQLTLTLNTKPVSGAKIIRTVHWKSKKTDTFTSDQHGHVELPATYQSSITQMLPVEFLSSQVITVEHEGREYKIWVYAKRDPGGNIEFSGKPIRLTCELSDEPSTKRAFGSVVKTACTWD